MWRSIEKGPYVKPMIPDPDDTKEQIIKPLSKMTEINKKQYIADVRVMNYLLQAMPNDIYNSMDACKTNQEMWEHELDKFAAKEGESLESMYERLTTLVNIMDRNNVRPIPMSINSKFLIAFNLSGEKCDRGPHVDQEPTMVAEDDEMSKDKEIDKLMALISLSFKKIYKPTKNNLRTSLNTSRSNHDNTLRINKGTGHVDQKPTMVAEDDEMSKDKEIDKLMALISLSFKKIYKPTKNNLRTSLNTSRSNHDNTLRINKGTGYDNQRVVNVVEARENVDQELEAHYLYMAQIQEVTLDDADNSRPIFDAEPLQKVQNNDDNYNVFAIKSEHPKQPESVSDTYPVEQDEHNIIIYSLDMSYDREQDDQDDNDDLAKERDLLASLIEKLKCEINDSKNRNKFLEISNKALVDKLKGEIEDLKTKNKSLESLNNHFKEANNELSKTNQLMFKDLKKFQAELDRYHDVNYALKLVKIILFIVDSGYSKYMTGNLKLLSSFVEKFLGTVKFRNDQIAPIIGYRDLKSICYIRNLKGNDLLTDSRGTDLYSITLQETYTPNPIYLMAKYSSSQAWLWHRHLSHLNFDSINLLLKNDIVIGLPKLKFIKDHLCSSCELGKASKKSFYTNTTPSSKRRLQLLDMDLCGPMRVESINGTKHVLVIVDDYSRYTWTHFLRSKYETPEVLIDFLKLVQRGLHAQVRTVRTDKGTKFLNKTLHAYFAQEGIEHQTSVTRTPKQDGVVKRRNCNLVKAGQTMLSAAKVPLDGKNLVKMKEKGDACIFVAYSTQSREYRVYNKRTKVIVKTIHVNFDELSQMASNYVSSDPVPQCPTTALEHDSLSLDLKSEENVPQAAEIVTTSNELDLLFSLIYTSIEHSNNTQNTSHAPTQAPTVTTTKNINQAETNKENAQVKEDEFINIFSTSVQERGETSSRHADSLNMHTFYQRYPSEHRWTKDHLLEQVIGNPSQSIRTRRQLETIGEMCMFALTVSQTELKNIKEAMADSAWIEVMHEELHQFDRLDIHQSPRSTFLNQAKYAQEILNKHGMTSCDSIGIPMATKQLDDDLTGTPVDQTEYHSMVGALMYLTSSRPDIVHATCYCARYQARPTEKHLTAVKRIFRTEYQLADVFTKALPEDRFKPLARRLGMRCLTPEELKVLANESA
uniref:Integrase catalytic domain-containing protein n=1 Tax=Tanacetum cinerariifolium TaxID=118510 RepID=A0A6L2M473_TANCI|nr:hypothetical protein [Tanacetum cinerariifolium]